MLIEDIERDIKNGGAKIRMQKSKADQDKIGVWLQISNESLTALDEWLKKAKIKEGKIFRGITPSGEILNSIHPAQINRIYKKIAKQANLTDYQISKISGHSFSVGRAQDLLNSGASMPLLLHKGRWTKDETVMHYTENM